MRTHARPVRTGCRVLAVLVGVALAATAAAPAVVKVRRGDTLSELAQQYGTTVEALRRSNDLADDDVLLSGTTLTLGSTRSTRTSSTRTHTVAGGENVTQIAARYGVGVRTVLDRNDLPADGHVEPGDALTIPVPVRATTPQPTAAPAGVADGVAARATAHRAQLAGRAVPSKAQVRQLVTTAASRQGLDPSLALAVSYHESGFQQRVVSPVDAIGAMQVLPSNTPLLSRSAGRPLDLLEAEDNVTAGVLLLRELRRTTGSDEATLAAYYQGLGSIARKGVLPQTEQYIANIEALRPRFR